MLSIQEFTPEFNSLPPDFVSFLNEFPAGSKFNLWNVQGAMRFTREGIPDHQSYEPELQTAQKLGLIEPADEDVKWSEREWDNGYPRHLHAGSQFKRTARPALVALNADDLQLQINQLESELADAMAERDDFLEAHKSLRDHPESYEMFVTELTKPIDELRAKVRAARAILHAKEVAQN
jgi:hypothetical protein